MMENSKVVIAQALEGARGVSMLAILMDSKPAISGLRKLDKGLTPPRSEIEARNSASGTEGRPA